MPGDFKFSLSPIFISSTPEDMSSVKTVSISFLEQAVKIKTPPNHPDYDLIQAFLKAVIEAPTPIKPSVNKSHRALFTEEKFNSLINFIRLTRAYNIIHAENNINTPDGEIIFLKETQIRFKLLSHLVSIVHKNPALKLTDSEGYSLLMAMFAEDTSLLLDNISDSLYHNHYKEYRDFLQALFEEMHEKPAILIREMIKIEHPNKTHFSMDRACFALSLWTFAEGKYCLAINDSKRAEKALNLLEFSMKGLTSSTLEVMMPKMTELKVALKKIEQKSASETKSGPSVNKKKKKSDLTLPKPEVPELEAKIKEAKAKNEKLRAELATLKKQAIKPSPNISLLNEKEDLETAQATFEQQLTQFENSKTEKIKEFEAILAKLKQEEAAFQSQTQTLEQQYKTQKRQEREAAQKTEIQRNTLKTLQKEVEELKSALVPLQKMLAEKTEIFKKIQIPAVALPSAEDRQLAAREQEKLSLEQDIQRFKAENKKISEQCAQFQTEVTALTNHLATMKAVDEKQQQAYQEQAQAAYARTQMPPAVVYQYAPTPAYPPPVPAPAIYPQRGYNIRSDR